MKPGNDTRVASYLPGVPASDSIYISKQYKERGVNMSNIDGHLHIPKIQLSDEGMYNCTVDGVVVVEVEVLGT